MGKHLYYVKDFAARTSVWKVPVAGGEETQVLDCRKAAYSDLWLVENFR